MIGKYDKVLRTCDTQRFLCQMLNEQTKGIFTEEHLQTEEWQSPCQIFESKWVGK
jgi:hypothetical protein